MLAFRGTLGGFDLATDFLFLALLLRFKVSEKAHLGFSLALDCVWERIKAALVKVDGPVFLTGHSLDGALATLATCRMLNDPDLKEKVGALYTFGSPRVGTEGFSANFNGTFHARIVHENDLVAQVPPAFSFPSFPRYQHVGLVHRIWDRGEMHVDAAVNDDMPDQRAGLRETLSMFAGMLAGVTLGSIGAPTKPLRDHTPRLYIDALARILKTQ